MKRKMFSLLLCAALVATLLAGCGSSSSTTTETLKLGAIFNTTGYMAAYDGPAEEGFALAVDEINANGGINGMQIECTTINGQSDATENANAATKLIDVDGAVVVAGICESGLAMSAGTVCQDAGVPYITVGATLPDMPERVGDDFFLACYGDNVQAYASAEYAYNDLGARTAYVIEDTTSEYTQALSKYFREKFEELGGTIVLYDTYDENGYTDFSANVEKVLALDEQPDVLFFASFTDQAPVMLSQYRAKGLDMPVLSGDGFDSTTIAEIAGDAANNVYFTTHVDYTSDSELVTNFIANYTEAYGVAPENAFSALGYDTVYLIKYAIENYVDGDVTPEAIRDALEQVEGFEGVTGTVSFSADNHVPSKTVTLNEFVDGEVVNIKNFVPDM